MPNNTQYPCPYPQCRQSFDDLLELDEHLIAIARTDDEDHQPDADDELPAMPVKYRGTDVLAACPIDGKLFYQRATMGTPETCGVRCAAVLRARRKGDGTALSPRQAQVHTLMERGLSNADIAVRLGVSVSTVRNTASTMYRKLGISGRGR